MAAATLEVERLESLETRITRSIFESDVADNFIIQRLWRCMPCDLWRFRACHVHGKSTGFYFKQTSIQI